MPICVFVVILYVIYVDMYKTFMYVVLAPGNTCTPMSTA